LFAQFSEGPLRPGFMDWNFPVEPSKIGVSFFKRSAISDLLQFDLFL